MSDNREQTRDDQTDYIPDSLREHTFDGIREYDNRLPNWWLAIMYGSIVFALLYWIVFHTLEIRPTPREAFDRRMAAAQEAELARMAESGLSDELLLMMSETPTTVAEGRNLYDRHCVACHKDRGQGLVGPNLTDDMWLHGCAPMDLHAIVADGVATKGMPAWMNQLGPSRVSTVVSYVLTLRNTNVPGKEPEGEPCR
ncbi:MAG: c-type cytochrome [bacterium]|nr:c-type cytochrome [bacterium]